MADLGIPVLMGLDFLQTIAQEIADDELTHVIFLRGALGAAAVPMPLVRLIPTNFGGCLHRNFMHHSSA